jgi:hypothetical protein
MSFNQGVAMFQVLFVFELFNPSNEDSSPALTSQLVTFPSIVEAEKGISRVNDTMRQGVITTYATRFYHESEAYQNPAP